MLAHGEHCIIQLTCRKLEDKIMAKYKAKPSYKDLKDNFVGLGSGSTHLRLLDNQVIEYNGSLPEEISECLTEIGKKKSESK